MNPKICKGKLGSSPYFSQIYWQKAVLRGITEFPNKQLQPREGTTTTMNKKRVDILLNAVFRANDDIDEHDDAQATSRGSIESEMHSNGNGESHEGAKQGTESHAQGGSTSSVGVGGIIKVDTDTNIEVKHDESSQSGKLELRGESDGKIKLGL